MARTGQYRPDSPLVSVLTTSYNHSRWLQDTLSSVDQQDYPNVEHVVVDDGSTDASVAVLEKWPSSRLRWLATENQGQARALNEAFGASDGEIIGWLSSDDAYYGCGALSDIVDAFARHPEAAVIYGHAVLVDENGLQLQAEWVPPVRVLGWELPMHILQPSAFVRRSALGDKFVDDSFDVAMDTELWLRLRGPHRLERLDRILAVERHHPTRKSYLLEAETDEEMGRLNQAYRPAGGRHTHRRGRFWGAAYRLMGLTLVPRMKSSPAGFDGYLDSRTALIRRQVSVPRSHMASASGARRS